MDSGSGESRLGCVRGMLDLGTKSLGTNSVASMTLGLGARGFNSRTGLDGLGTNSLASKILGWGPLALKSAFDTADLGIESVASWTSLESYVFQPGEKARGTKSADSTVWDRVNCGFKSAAAVADPGSPSIGVKSSRWDTGALRGLVRGP